MNVFIKDKEIPNFFKRPKSVMDGDFLLFAAEDNNYIVLGKNSKISQSSRITFYGKNSLIFFDEDNKNINAKINIHNNSVAYVGKKYI